MEHPNELIEAIRKSYIHAETVYTSGGCYQFHLILKCVFPDAVAHYDSAGGHVVTEIDGSMYDITGDVGEIADLIPLSHDAGAEDDAKTWRFDWGAYGTDFHD